ncbi:MAG: LuxR C-terminal-related transcriptional regulator [Defluviicoccus sp.]|nr:LuxR C-terminal-related transcriptional regulator [Defluviicoccus sp.]
MSGTDSGTQGAEQGESPAHPGGASGRAELLPWLLGQKIVVPDPVAGCLDRDALVEQAMPTQRRLTVLQAPGGFGKTTVLAECCRRLRERGVATAWVSVDEQDEPAVLDAYIAHACQSATAGSNVRLDGLASADLGQLQGETEPRTRIAMRKIAELDGPFVLAFDELERMGNPDSAALIDFLLERGPPNLHLSFACRRLPAGVNVAGAVLEGRAAILATEDLRFSRSEVAAFFEGNLTEERLAAMMSESGGWPFALRLSRNEMEGGSRQDTRASQQFVENWVESRLFAGLGSEDREFLLDIGLFEWMDAALLDDVLERSDSMRRIDAMSVLVGMLEPVRDGATDIWRLHPLIREHCVRRRFRETPQRFRTVHRRIANALARRGQTAAAMRHAVEAGEAELAGEIMERAGGARLFSREGLVQFRDAERRLSEDVVGARPRLGLARCLALILSGRMDDAKERYRSLTARIGNLEDDAGDAALELAAENCVVRGMIILYGGERLGSALMRTHLAEVARLAESSSIDVLTRGIMEFSLCIMNVMTANFRTALKHAVQAQPCLAQSRYMTMFLEIHVGQIAMAQGRVKDAAAHYGRAAKVAKESYGVEAESAVISEVLLQELALECGRAAPDAELTRIPQALATGSTPSQAYAAASGAIVELKLRDEGVDGALAAAEDMLGYVRGARLPALVRYVSALRVSLLAIAGRFGDAASAWRSDDLPGTAAGCLDLAGQSWREMEALSCARLRLAIGRGCFEEGRGFAGELRAAAAARGLRRTLMRALALTVVLERRAGEAAAAAGHLEAYLELYAETPYAGPLVRERADCAGLLAAFLESAPDSPGAESARSILAAMERVGASRPPALSEREREVLRRLEGERDKQIAEALGLSAYGVRYHIRKLFSKLNARDRTEAVRRAREIGLLPDGF